LAQNQRKGGHDHHQYQLHQIQNSTFHRSQNKWFGSVAKVL
jgi:hypothetical protein